MSNQSSSLDDSSLNIAFFSVLTVSLLLLFIFSEGGAVPKEGDKQVAILSSLETRMAEEKLPLLVDDENALLSLSPPVYIEPVVLAVEVEEEEYEKRWVRLTAYSPLDPSAQEGMCFEGDPKRTASGTFTRDGVVAANFLPFGTKIKIPSLFGEKIFTVEDRMSARFNNTVDVVLSSQQQAIRFGVKNAYIEILK